MNLDRLETWTFILLVNINKELIKEIDSLHFSIDSTIAEIREKERKIDSLKYEISKSKHQYFALLW